MVEAARLVLVADASGLKQGETALDSLARTGSRVEGTLTINAKSIEQAMARIGATMGGLDQTMRSLEAAVSGSMGRSAQETERSARSFEDLRRSIDPAYAASQRYAEVQREVAGMVERGEASQRAANIVLEQAASRYMGVATAAERAEQAQRQQAQAVAQATGNYQALRASLDPVYASSKRYEAAQETLTAAVKQGVISQQEMNRVLAMAERQYLAPASGLRGLAGAADDAGKGLGRFAPKLTNLSFQIQDFAVQVASGQSALMAFTQQFPQAAGALGFSGKIALLGAGLGTLVAVGMAVAPMFFDIGDKAKSAEDAVSQLSGSFNAYKAALDGANMSMADATAKFGDNARAARELYVITADLARIKFAQDYAASLGSITKPLGDLRSDLKLVEIAMRDAGAASADYENAVYALNQNFGLTVPQAKALVTQMDALGKAKGVEAQSEAASVLTRTIADLLEAGVKLPPIFAHIAQSTGDAAIQGLAFTGTMDDAGRSANAAAAATSGLSSQLAQATGFAAQLVATIGRVPAAMAAIGGEVDGIMKGLQRQNATLNYQLTQGISASAASIKTLRDEAIKTAAASGATADELARLGMEFQPRIDEAEKLAGSIKKSSDALDAQAKAASKAGKASKGAARGTSDAEKAAKKAARESERLAESLDKEAQRWRETLDPVAKYNAAMAELAQLRGRLSDDEMAQAQRRLNVELADSLPLAGEFVDVMTDGLLEGFKGTLSDLGSMFKRWLAQMIATAAKNRIVVAMGFGGMGGVPGMAMAGVPGMAAGIPGLGGIAGLAGGVMGGIGSFLGTDALSLALTGAGAPVGVLGGLSSVVGGLASGGFSGGLAAIGSALGNATSGLAGLGAAAGALAVPLAAVGAVFSFFSSKTKELDRGLRVTVDGMDAVIETYRKTEKRRFWGLSKKRNTDYDPASAEIADPIDRALDKVQQSVLDAAKSLDVGQTAFANFAYQFKLSTKDMTDEQALQAIQEEIGKFGDAFADMIPGLRRYQAEGEGAAATLARLSNSLGVVNGALGDLGLVLYDVSVRGAGTAAAFADLFGGLDQFLQASSAYYEAFYSDAERFARLQEVSTKALRDAGLAVPATREAYRTLVDAQNLSTEAGRKATAVLLQLAPAFDQIYDAAEATRAAAAQAIADANASRADLLDSLLTDQQRAAQAQAEIAATFAALNLQVPTTLDGLRAIIAGLDLTGEAGRDALARISGIADALRDRLTPVQQAAERATSGGSSGRDNAASEREQLERELLQLTGNTVELLRRQRLDVDPTNRALWDMVKAAKAASEALDKLTTDQFATRVEYELARNRQANINAMPAQTAEAKTREERQSQDSDTLVRVADFLEALMNNSQRQVRELKEIKYLQGGRPGVGGQTA